MTWAASAAQLLAAAEGATLSHPVVRSGLVPGPGFARDCRQLAVFLESQRSVSARPVSDLPQMSCAVVPAIRLGLAFVADCVPAPADDGAPPPAAEVESWTEDFLADAEAIWEAVADAKLAGTLGQGCDSVQIEDAQIRGPEGGVAQFIIFVSLQPD